MDMLKKLLLIFLFLSTSHFIFSQITISSPVLRQVFQRDLNKQAVVTITGSYSQPIDTIQVRFTPVTAGQGTAVDWTVIKSAPLGGLFKGSVTVKGGWYVMEVRGLLGGKLVGSASKLDRVGVGEVFVIGGQSNAGGSGERGINETGSTDDRVNCADFINIDPNVLKSPNFDGMDQQNVSFNIGKDVTDFSLVSFSRLEKTSSIGPRGLGPFYWGKVGDALAAKLNVPIMFFNTAWAGASIRVWAESAQYPNGKLVNGKLVGPESDAISGIYYDVGTPYKNLNAILRYYGINLGVRSILWMQGETENVLNLDNDPNNNVTLDQYKTNLESLLKQTRLDLGNNKLSWVVARTSYSGLLGCGTNANAVQQPSPIIVNAQNQAIANPTSFPIYPGPFTDNIQIPRATSKIAQCVHFTGSGLTDVANAWVKALTEDNKDFFDTVEPIVADTIPSISLECISSSALKLTLPDGYASYEWVNTESGVVAGKTKSVNVGSGTYIARVTRSNGNIVQVPRVTVKANTPPKAPIVTSSSDLNFCLGTSVTLQSSTEADNPIYEWVSTPAIANLARTKDISVSREGTYKLRVIDKNACASAYSSDVKLVAKPRPEKPVISTSGSTEFCDGQSIVLTSSNAGASSYLWSSGENTQVITVKKSGSYSVQTRSSNGCLSPSSTDNISVLVNPLPVTPQIRALSDTVFCDGGNVSLVLTPSDNSKVFGWNRNNSVNNNDNSTTIRITGTELVRGFVTDNKGCKSVLSNAIQVVKKDNPKILTISAKGNYSFVARSDSKVNEYLWKLDGKAISAKDSLIKTVDRGSYTVIGKNIYTVKSSATPLICLSAESEKFTFDPYDDKGLSVYPNPSSGRFTLESRYDLDNVSITVYSIDGKLLYDGKVDVLNAQKVIDLSPLPEGSYILRVSSSTFKISKIISITR